MGAHVTMAAPTISRTWPKVALRWLPTFVGYPLGGLAAKLIVGPVDALGPAIAGGAITGLVLGSVQWIGLRRSGIVPEAWIAATAVGLAAGLGLGAAAVGYRTDLGVARHDGCAVRRRAGRRAGDRAASAAAVGLALVWPVFLAGLWALGWTITSSAGIDVESQYTVFGSSGAIVVTAATSVLPIALQRRRLRLA